jgi:hypothetical protein
MVNKTMVEIVHTEKSIGIYKLMRGVLILDYTNAFIVYIDPFYADNQSPIFNLPMVEFAILQSAMKTTFSEHFQNHSNMSLIVIPLLEDTLKEWGFLQVMSQAKGQESY